MGKKAAKLVASAAVFGLVAGACFVGVSVAKDKLYPSQQIELKQHREQQVQRARHHQAAQAAPAVM